MPMATPPHPLGTSPLAPPRPATPRTPHLRRLLVAELDVVQRQLPQLLPPPAPQAPAGCAPCRLERPLAAVTDVSAGASARALPIGYLSVLSAAGRAARHVQLQQRLQPRPQAVGVGGGAGARQPRRRDAVNADVGGAGGAATYGCREASFNTMRFNLSYLCVRH